MKRESKRRRRSKIMTPTAIRESEIMRPFWPRKVNSKKSLANGHRKMTAIIAMIVTRRAERSLLSGFEIQ